MFKTFGRPKTKLRRPLALISLAGVAILAGCWNDDDDDDVPPIAGGITRVEVESTTSPAFEGKSFGSAGQYEIVTGRAYGEVDPADPKNAVITDLQLAPRNARGMVEYVTTFRITKPIDLTKASGVLWHDVPNRGGRPEMAEAERLNGDIQLTSGWSGDNSGSTAEGTANRDYVVVPVAKNADGSPITGQVSARLVNGSGMSSQAFVPQANPFPYKPVTLDTSKATLSEIDSEAIDGTTGPSRTIAPQDWVWAKCDSANPFPGTPDPSQICLRNGFSPNKMYQVVFTAQDPRVLGLGLAAFRDIGSFLKYSNDKSADKANPLNGAVRQVIGRGASQSGRLLHTFLHLGFNQDNQGRRVQDGQWLIISGGHVWLNTRFGVPDSGLKNYDLAMEGPQWWSTYEDKVRGLPASSLLDKCKASDTCPKIMEHFGAAELATLRLGLAWVGSDAQSDIPLPDNVRRYYLPGTRHGGGDGVVTETPLPVPACPSPNWGTGTFPRNPLPHTETVNALRVHMRKWVTDNIAPPASVYPRLADGTLGVATKESLGFPTIPGLPANYPTGLVLPTIDYDFGPQFDPMTASGIQTLVPPRRKQSLVAVAPKVDSDGNERGGVPLVYRDAPLGTYLGMNITNGGFYNGQPCSFEAGMIPFSRTKAERLANGDPRPSLEERYGTHEGYVSAVRAAAANAVSSGFLLQADAEALIARAEASNVLR